MISDSYIPRRLDDAWKIGLWDFDVALPVLVALFVGWLSGTKVGFALCFAAGLFVSRMLSRIKADKHPSYALHWAYWSLPTNPLTYLKATPPSDIRRMVG